MRDGEGHQNGEPYINTEEEGVIDDKYYDAKGNEISYDEYVTILERSREK